MLERELQNNVIKLCTARGLLCYHTYDSRRSEPGFPDLVIVGSNDVLYRELKSARGRLSEEQVFWLAALNDAGQDARVWRPVDWPDQITADLAHLKRVTAARPLPSQDAVRAHLQGKSKVRADGTT